MDTQNLTNINLLTMAQYNSITNPSANNLYAVETPAVITQCYSSGTEGYILFSNGLCIQYGKHARVTQEDTITLYKGYSTLDYIIQATFYNTGLNADGRPLLTYETNKTVNSFVFNSYTGYTGCYWMTIGYVDLG